MGDLLSGGQSGPTMGIDQGYTYGFGSDSGSSSSPGGLLGSGFDVNLHQLPLIGNFFENPMEKYKQEAMMQAGQITNQYRESMGGARMNALNQQLGQFAPVNAALAAMYGQAYTTPLDAQSPYSADHWGIGDDFKPPPKNTGVFGQTQKGIGNFVNSTGAGNAR